MEKGPGFFHPEIAKDKFEFILRTTLREIEKGDREKFILMSRTVAYSPYRIVQMPYNIYSIFYDDLADGINDVFKPFRFRRSDFTTIDHGSESSEIVTITYEQSEVFKNIALHTVFLKDKTPYIFRRHIK